MLETAEQVVEMLDLKKYYTLDGGERVHALRGVSLHASSEFYPILEGEFVMVSSCPVNRGARLRTVECPCIVVCVCT